jgi:CheY-like chemotaxis protein
MWTPPEVLILEDDPEQLRELAQAVAASKLAPLTASSPRQALARLEHRRPLLAILDLDMSLVPRGAAADEGQRSVYDVLRRLHDRHGNCIPLVFSAKVETIDDQAHVYAAHPHALFQTKRHGLDRLIERLQGLLQARVGDLTIRDGAVVHMPSGESIGHRVAVALVASRRANHHLVLDDSEARAARRFQSWLDRVGSGVRVRALGNRHYHLLVKETQS